MSLEAWAIRHGITHAALHELRQMFGAEPIYGTPSATDGKSEAAVSTLVRLDASKSGARLWRNNSGAGYLQDGSFIRWGLANESAAMNKCIKSSDLIGITPRVIGGETVGVFTAIEVKASGWRYSGTERERAQAKFHEIVVSMGGIGRFVSEVS